MSGFVPKANWHEQQSRPNPEVLTAHIETDAVSQFGCGYCLGENVTAPSNPVYMWAGTTMCAKHFKVHILKQAETQPKEITKETNLVP